MSDVRNAVGQVTYADAGVDVDEGARAVDAIKAAVATTARPEVIGGLGGFGSCFSAAALKDMDDPVLVSGTDGVGTKLAIAQLLGRNDTVGEDLVAMCVDDIVPLGAEPLFFLDYVAVGKLKAEAVAEIVGGIARGCRKSGCALVGGEMAEHPGVMNPDDYDLAGFVVGVVDRPKMLGPKKVSAGDVILGLPSSGIHSNGYSLVRKVAIEGKLRYSTWETREGQRRSKLEVVVDEVEFLSRNQQNNGAPAPAPAAPAVGATPNAPSYSAPAPRAAAPAPQAPVAPAADVYDEDIPF